MKVFIGRLRNKNVRALFGSAFRPDQNIDMVRGRAFGSSVLQAMDIDEEPMNQPPGWWVIRMSDSVYELIQRQRKTTAEYQMLTSLDQSNPGQRRLPGQKFGEFTQIEATVAAHHAYDSYRALFESNMETRLLHWLDILQYPNLYPDICLPALYSCLYSTLFDEIVYRAPMDVLVSQPFNVRNYQAHHRVSIESTDAPHSSLCFVLRQSKEARQVYETLYVMCQRMGVAAIYNFFTAQSYRTQRLYHVDPAVVWFRSVSLLNLPEHAVRGPLALFMWHLNMHGGDFDKTHTVYDTSDINNGSFSNWIAGILHTTPPPVVSTAKPSVSVARTTEIVASIKLDDL